MSNLGENIKNFRTFRGISQQTLAKKLGKTKSVISNWERGTNAPDPDSIELLCKFLDVTPSQIFGWEENQEYLIHAEKMAAYRADMKKLEEEKDRIEREIMNIENLMWQEENPLLDDLDD